MSTSQAVFLFDICSFSQVESVEQLNKSLKCLRLVCLRLITELSGKIPSFRFGFKFFDSKGTVTQISDRFPLCEVNLEAFENLETQITRRYERYASVCKVVAENSTKIANEKLLTLFGTKSNVPVKVLNLILTQILCEYQWDSPEICSPVRNSKGNPSQNFDKNFVFLISPLPASESDLNDYFGVSEVSKIGSVKDLLMPTALYKKFVVEANISLAWLSPTDLSHANVVEGKKSSTEIFEKALTELCGALVPLQVLAESNLFPSQSLLRVSDHTDKKSTEAIENLENLHFQSGSYFSLPFSCLFSHYVTSNLVSYPWPSENCSTLSFPNKLSIKIQLLSTSVYSERSLNMCNKANTSSPGPKRSRRSCVKMKSIVNQPDINGYNFLCQYTIPRGFYGNPDSTFVCLPALKDPNQQSSALREINKTLLRQNQNLVLKCETKVGFMGIGILSPLSEANSMISIFASTPEFLSEKIVTGDTKPIDNVLNFIDGKKERLLKCLENFSRETVSEDLGREKYKTFDVTSMEPWYIPTFKTSNLLTEMKTKWAKREKSHSSNFMSKLQHHYRTNSNLSRKRSSEGLVRQSPRAPKLKMNGGNAHQNSTQNSEIVPLNLNFKNEGEALGHLREIYDSAVQLSEPVVKSARSIINIVLMFFHSKAAEAALNEVDAFMNTHILVAPSQIAQKYNDKADTAEIQKKVKEYQLQVIMHLELACHVSSSVDMCVNKVTALLRALNFVVGPVELSRFLRDTVVGNYSSNLHHLLAEIGDELNIPLLPELFSPSSVSGTESPVNFAKSSTLSQNSIPSWRSTSSSSQRSIKSNSLSRRSLSGHFNGSQNRQIMVPTRLLRKHKASEKIEPQPIRKSPRLAKNNSSDLNSSTNAKASKICRNLFNAAIKPRKRCKSISPEKGNHKRRKLLTPKGHRTLKTNYVPETPSPKQGCSFQRRMARLRAKTDTVTEVMESPVCAGKSANISKLYLLRKNGSFYSKSTSNEYEDDVKQSNSILLSNDDDREKVKPSRLFSELLDSPSVDHPTRRCSKRLFQNCTPTKTQSNNSKAPPKFQSNSIKTPPGTPKSKLNSVKTPPGTPKSKLNSVKTPPNTPKCQLSSLKTPPSSPESHPSILKIHCRTPKTNPSKSKPNVMTYPSTSLKSILKRTPSKIIEDSNMAQSLGSPASAVVLSLPMHEFPTPDKSTSPNSDVENFTSLQTTEVLKQSIDVSRNIKKRCPSSVIESSRFVNMSFAPQQSEQGHHVVNAETQNIDKNGNRFQYFSSPRKTSSKISLTPIKNQQAFNQIGNVSQLRSSRKLRSEKETVSSNIQSPSKAQNVHIGFRYNSDKDNEDSLLNDKNDFEIKAAFTGDIDSPKKVAKSVSFAHSTNHEDIKFHSQDDNAYPSNVNTPPNAKVQQHSVCTPTLKSKKLYTSPTKSSLLHLATSPVIFIKKKNQPT